MGLLDYLNQNDLVGARDFRLVEHTIEVGSSRSWDSPQYTANKTIQAAIRQDSSRDTLQTFFGLEVLRDRYFLKNGKQIVESIQDFYARVAAGIAELEPTFEAQISFAQKLYDIMSKHWFTPATPILANVGTTRGLPVSCFLNATQDDIQGIMDVYVENAWMAKGGGGIGTYWGGVRHMGAELSTGGRSSGIVPFLKVTDSQSLAISQGGLRRGSASVYLDIWHPEIEEFIEIRRESGGDINRQCHNLHNAVVIDDEFMHAVEARSSYALRCPRTGAEVKRVDAFDLFKRIIALRVETGEPYILFIDRVREATPTHHKAAGLIPQQSNLCVEVCLPTNAQRSAICCLGSLNLERYSEWQSDASVVVAAVQALDNVISIFIRDAHPDRYAKSIRSAIAERSIGLGVMGYHGYLMSKGIPFESVQARIQNRLIFGEISKQAKAASIRVAEERGRCPDAVGTEFKQRNSYIQALAPTASISILTGGATPSIEPMVGNVFLHKTLSGSHQVRNRYLADVLTQCGQNTPIVWKSIIQNDGSVQHFDFLSPEQKAVFKTAFEMNQRELVAQAGARQEFICQSQSLNLFFDGQDLRMSYLYAVHMAAWKEGCKSLYYIRSKSVAKADSVERKALRDKIQTEECAVCQ